MRRPPDPDLLRSVGARLQKARKDAGFTSHAAVAKLLGMPRPQTIGDWESGNGSITCTDMVALCQLYGVSADWVLGTTELPEVRAGGVVIDQAVEHAVLSANSAQEAEAAIGALNAGSLHRMRLGFRIPPRGQVITEAEWEARHEAVEVRIRGFARNKKSS